MVNIQCLTNELIDEYILPHLHYHDVASLSMCSEQFRDLFHYHPFWKQVFLREKGYQHYNKRLNKLCKSNTKWNPTMNWLWTDELRQLNMCNLIIKNNTKGIPFDIYCMDLRKHLIKVTKKPILPGRLFVSPTYPNKKWMCIPTREWFSQNPYENVGFSFVINVLQLMIDPVTKKTGFIREIREPKDLIPIKGTKKQYKDYKKQFVRIKINKEEVEEKIKKNKSNLEEYKKEITALQKKLNIFHGNLDRAKVKKKTLEYLWDVVK